MERLLFRCHLQLPVTDSTIALAMEIVPFSISAFVKMAFTGSTAPLVSTSLPFLNKVVNKGKRCSAHTSQRPKRLERIPVLLA